LNLNFDQETNGMYKLHKPDFDDIALELLREHLATAIDSPCEIDINYLIRDCLYLDVYSKHLSPDKSILGLVAFDDTTIPCYDLHFNQTTFDVYAGNIVIDLSLSGQWQLPRRRFTLAHELSHWVLHRSYHSPTNQVFALKKTGYLPCGDATIAVKKKVLKTDSDKEEWQANSLAAAILMPKFAFLYCAHQEIRRQYGALSSPINDSDDPERYKTTIENIAGVFNVSYQATEIRLDQYNLII